MKKKMKMQPKIKKKVDESDTALIRDLLNDFAEIGREKMNALQQLDTYHLGLKDIPVLEKIANDKKEQLSVRNEARWVIDQIKKRVAQK
ncbi:MAG: hypothetical protein AB1468_02220 [Candidatus Micrarchaeota archaeon]